MFALRPLGSSNAITQATKLSLASTCSNAAILPCSRCILPAWCRSLASAWAVKAIIRIPVVSGLAFKLVRHDKKLVRFYLLLEPKTPDDV